MLSIFAKHMSNAIFILLGPIICPEVKGIVEPSLYQVEEMLYLRLAILFILDFGYLVCVFEGFPIVKVIYLVHQLILLTVWEAVLWVKNRLH